MPTDAIPQPAARRLWTFSELSVSSPESSVPTELWDGEIIMSPAPSPLHQEIVLNFATLLRSFVLPKGLGKVFVSPLDVVLSESRAVQPDVIYIAYARQSIVQDAIRGVPDLVAEVISPGSWKRDRVDKKGLYEQFGVLEYWIIDPEPRVIEVLSLEKNTYVTASRAAADQAAVSRLLNGFQVSWRELNG
jgi:Uma2 family endonuclease